MRSNNKKANPTLGGLLMTTLNEHIQIFQKLKIYPNKNAIIKMIWHIANDHSKEISCEDFIKAINTPTNAIQPIARV
jgi:hypothetical protein